MCEAKDCPNDIMESGNIIVSFGKNFIEFFCTQINDQINNNNNKLNKIKEISINNNNNNNDENSSNNINNNDNPYEILCIELYNNYIICGHKNGYLSTWIPGGESFLQRQGEIKVSDAKINKITTITHNNQDFLFLCCSDKTIKLFSFSESKIIRETKQFEDEVIDIKKIKNLENQDLIVICLQNGLIKVLNVELIPLFDMTSRFGIKNTRHIISMKNQTTTSEEGDLILVTEGNRIDVFIWIKPGSFKTQNKNQNQHQQQPHGLNPHFANQLPHGQIYGKFHGYAQPHFPHGYK